VGVKESGPDLKQESAASLEEVRAALDELLQDVPKLARLRKTAEWRLRAIGSAAEERTADDLIHDAIESTLAKERTWKKSAVDFYGHLLSVVKSISSHWAEQHRTVPLSSFDRVDDNDAVYNELLDSARVEGYRQRDEVEDRDLVQKIERTFQDDSLVMQLMRCIKSGLNGPETQADLGISKTEYETGMKRMRRKAKQLFS
jgi:hypothetical protein